MVTPHRTAAGLAAQTSRLRTKRSSAVPSNWTVRPDRQSQRVLPLTRRYEVAYLDSVGDIQEFNRVAPATPVFEDAFAALGHGVLISTATGPVAVEDLYPGTMIETVTHGHQPLLWVGAMTIYPGTAEKSGGEPACLTRLSTDSFGLGRPAPDLMLGPRARVLYRHSRCREILGTDRAFAPARAFADGVNVIEVTPVSPVKVYHLALHGQQTLLANGIEVESYHPGMQPDAMMDDETRELFKALFPHIRSLSDFGPMEVPRLTAFELESLRAA